MICADQTGLMKRIREVTPAPRRSARSRTVFVPSCSATRRSWHKHEHANQLVGFARKRPFCDVYETEAGSLKNVCLIAKKSRLTHIFLYSFFFLLYTFSFLHFLISFVRQCSSLSLT